MNVLFPGLLVTSALGLGLGSWWIVGAVGRSLDRLVRFVLAAGVALGTFLTLVSVLGRAFESFDAGMVAAASGGVLFAVLGGVAIRRVDRSPSAGLSRKSSTELAVVLVGLAALYGYISWKYQIHDERQLFGHKSMLEQLRRGIYPIHYPPLPDAEARYHYGFDILSGALARGLGWGSDLSIDVSTVFLALFMSLAAAAVAIIARRPRGAPFAAVAIHFGAGLAWILLAGVEDRHPRCLTQFYHPSCGVELFPTPFLNVFQHPVSLGVPLLLVLFGLATLEAESRERTWWPLLMVPVYAGLAISQIVYFALGGLAIVSVYFIWGPPESHFRGRRAVGAKFALSVAALLVGLGLAWLEGGMLAPSTVTDPALIHFRSTPGFPAKVDWGERAYHHIVNLGLGFVAFPFFVFEALRRRSFLALVLCSFAFGGMLVPHLFSYERSWDMVKFPSAAAFVLSLTYVLEVDARLVNLTTPWSWVRRAGRALLVGSGVVAATFLVFPLDPPYRTYDLANDYVDPVVDETIQWLWDNGYDPNQRVYAQDNIARELAVFGGLSVAGYDYDFMTLGVSLDYYYRFQRRNAEIRARMSREALRDLDIGWIVLSEEELALMGRTAQRALEQDGKHYRVVAEFPTEPKRRSRRIWRVQLDADE